MARCGHRWHDDIGFADECEEEAGHESTGQWHSGRFLTWRPIRIGRELDVEQIRKERLRQMSDD